MLRVWRVGPGECGGVRRASGCYRMSARPPVVYLVDDDAELRAMTATYLARNGVEAIALPSGDELMRRLRRMRPDLIVLDLMMPGMSGLDVCRTLRADQDDVPVIMLTARAEVVDRVIGFEFGADDYLAKPFDPRELLARIHAVLKRRPSSALPAEGDPVPLGAWVFLPARRVLRHGNTLQPLTDAEFALLNALTRRPGQALSRERLLEAMHGRDAAMDDRSVDVAVHRLRRLIEPVPESPRYIQTVRGRGYVFVPDDGAADDDQG